MDRTLSSTGTAGPRYFSQGQLLRHISSICPRRSAISGVRAREASIPWILVFVSGFSELYMYETIYDPMIGPYTPRVRRELDVGLMVLQCAGPLNLCQSATSGWEGCSHTIQGGIESAFTI